MLRITKEFALTIKRYDPLDKLSAIMRQLGFLEMAKRQASRKTPFVLGQIHDKNNQLLTTAIMFKAHTENHFAPELQDFADAAPGDAQYSVVYLTAEEAFLLTTFANTPIYSPVTAVPMKACLGAIFALLVGQMTTISLKVDDIELAPLAWIAAAMIIYPLCYSTWRGINKLTGTAEPICFDTKTLAIEGAKLGLVLVAALAAFVASDKLIAPTQSITDESYLNALVAGSITGGAFNFVRSTMDVLAGRVFLPKNKEAVSQFIGSNLLTAPTVFPLLLILNDLIQKAQGITPEQAGDITSRKNFVPTAANTIFGLPIYYKVVEWLLVHGIKMVINVMMCMCRCGQQDNTATIITTRNAESQPLLGRQASASGLNPDGSPGRPAKPTALQTPPPLPPKQEPYPDGKQHSPERPRMKTPPPRQQSLKDSYGYDGPYDNRQVEQG